MAGFVTISMESLVNLLWDSGWYSKRHVCLLWRRLDYMRISFSAKVKARVDREHGRQSRHRTIRRYRELERRLFRR